MFVLYSSLEIFLIVYSSEKEIFNEINQFAKRVIFAQRMLLVMGMKFKFLFLNYKIFVLTSWN